MPKQILFSLLLSIFIGLLGIGIIIPILPLYAKDLGAGGLALSFIIASFSVSRSLLQPIIGNLSDSLGRKKFLVAGLVIYGTAGLLIPEASSIPSLIAVRLFHGTGSAMIVPIAMAYISNLAPLGQEGRYMSYLNIAMFSGMGCGPIVGGIFFDTMGFSAVFYMMAAMSFLAAILLLITLPAQREIQQRELRAPLLQSLQRMLQERHTRGILIARYGTMIVMVPSMAFLPIVMDRAGYNSGALVGMVIACRTFINTLLQIPSGRWADRYSKPKLLALGAIAIITALALVPNASSREHFFSLYALLGCGEALVWPTLGAYASQKGREGYGHGTMMGAFNLSMSCGVLTGALLAGVSSDLLGFSWAYYIPAIAISVVTSIGLLFILSAEKDAQHIHANHQHPIVDRE